MKKTLLLVTTFMVASMGLSAQTVWNFSNSPFGAVGAAGGTAVIDFTKSYTTSDGLTIATDGTSNWTGLSTNSKTIDGIAYTYRLQSAGGGSAVAPSKIPVTRYLSLNVSGPSTINFGMISSSSSATRTLIIVNADQSVVDSIVNISGSTAATYSYNYTGGASKLYMYSRASGINFYYLSATNVVTTTSVDAVFATKGISFNGSQISNSNALKLSVYDVAGKRMLTASTNVSTASLNKGVYLVKAEGVDGTLKIIK